MSKEFNGSTPVTPISSICKNSPSHSQGMKAPGSSSGEINPTTAILTELVKGALLVGITAFINFLATEMTKKFMK